MVIFLLGVLAMGQVYPEKTSIPGLVPLTAASGTYSRDGVTVPLGLYPSGFNTAPEYHAEKLIHVCAYDVLPINDQIQVVIHGMSNVASTAAVFIGYAASDPIIDPKVHFANIAHGGADLVETSDPESGYWTGILPGLEAAGGVVPEEVQVLIFMEPVGSIGTDNSNPANIPMTFPGGAEWVADKTKIVIDLFKARYPNLKVVILSAATYRGYGGEWGVDAPVSKCPELAMGYEEAFGVRTLIGRQIDGDPGYDYDECPILTWGLYPWSNGIEPAPLMGWDNGVAMTTLFEDVKETDGIHPDVGLRDKVSLRLLDALKELGGIRMIFRE